MILSYINLYNMYIYLFYTIYVINEFYGFGLINKKRKRNLMKNHLKVYVNLIYSGSRDYTTKKGEQKTLYKFCDNEQNFVENVLNAPVTADVGTVCTCCLELGQRWLDTEKRYERYFRVISAIPAKK